MDRPKCAGTAPIAVDLEEGKKYAWCTCGLSENQPFCDGKHKQEGCGFVPDVFTAEKSETVYLCTCKATKTPPRCDGAHQQMKPESGDGGPKPVTLD